MVETLKVGNVVAGLGELKFGHIETNVALKNDVKVGIPVTVLRGKKDGPTLTLVTVVHGREFSNIEVVRRVMREEIDPEDLSGSIIALVANPWGFELEQYTVPQDNKNLSRAFPGDPKGTASERMAHAITQHAFSKSDYAIDFHTAGGIPFCLTYAEFTDDPELKEKAQKMAEAFGVTVIDRRLKEAKYLTATPTHMNVSGCCMEKGVAAITLELVEGSRIVKSEMKVGVRGLTPTSSPKILRT